MDTSKIGIATAKAMDEIDRLIQAGEIKENAYVGACYIVVAMDSPTPEQDRDKLRAVATQCFVFGEPEELYIQNGLIHMALDNYGGTNLEEDDDAS